MKTLHVFHNSDLKNGVDKTTCTLIHMLQKSGGTPIATVPGEGDVSEYLSAHDIPYRIIPYSCCNSDASRALIHYLGDSSRQAAAMTDFIQQVKPDIIHINTGHLLHAGIAAAQCHIPAIWHIHAPFDNDLKRYQQSIGLEGYRWILQNLSSQVIGVSNDVTKSICKHVPPERVKTLYNGVDVAALNNDANISPSNIRKELNLPEDAELVIGVGRISAQKDFATFARVARQITKTRTNTFFIIAGPKQEPEAVQLLMEELEDPLLNQKLFTLGPRSDVPALLAQSNAFLSTAIFEGQGVAALEAMALHTPVIAMACQGLRECVNDGVDGLLVPPGDEAAAARAVISTLSDQQLSSNLCKMGFESVSTNFSSEKYGREFVTIAEEAISTGATVASNDALAVIKGLLSEIDKTEQRLMHFEQQTNFQRFKLLLWHSFHPS